MLRKASGRHFLRLAGRNPDSRIVHDRPVVDNADGGDRIAPQVEVPARFRRRRAVSMIERLNDARILIYSHDSFGLGHLRRCRAIAHAIVDRFKGVSILILSGSPIIGSFDFLPRVDFVPLGERIAVSNV